MTTDMSICFPVPCTSKISAGARLIKTRRSPCPVSVDLYDANRTLIAVSQVFSWPGKPTAK
jgi:hypothetical protein